MFATKALFILLCLSLGTVFSQVTISSTTNSDHVSEYNITLETSQTAGQDVKFTFSVGDIDGMTEAYHHSMACFPNNDDNELADGDSLNGWTFIIYYGGTSHTDPANYRLFLGLCNITKNGADYDYQVLIGSRNDLIEITNATNTAVTGGVFTGSFELDATDAAATTADISYTHAICFANKDSTVNSNALATPSLSGINLISQYVMIEYPPSGEDTMDVGGKRIYGAFFSKLSIVSSMLATVLWTQM